jgi:hypothetical protein
MLREPVCLLIGQLQPVKRGQVAALTRAERQDCRPFCHSNGHARVVNPGDLVADVSPVSTPSEGAVAVALGDKPLRHCLGPPGASKRTRHADRPGSPSSAYSSAGLGMASGGLVSGALLIFGTGLACAPEPVDVRHGGRDAPRTPLGDDRRTDSL